MSKQEYWDRHGTFILYNIYGFSATLLETFLYWLFYVELGVNNVFSTILATFITITYAFFTNKTMVYKSRDWRLMTVVKEASSFYGFRTISTFFNIGYMYVTVDLLHWMPVMMKMIAALIVGMINYILGKKFIFRDRRYQRKTAEEIARDRRLICNDSDHDTFAADGVDSTGESLAVDE